MSAISMPSTLGIITVWELTVAFWAGRGHDYCRDGCPTTEHRAWCAVMAQLNAVYGSTPANDFGPGRLKTLRQTWVDAQLARASCNRNTRKIVELFRWAVESELLPAATWHALKAVASLRKGRTTAPEPTPVGPVSMADVDATLPQLSPQLAAMVRLQAITGARPGEICQLRPCDVDRSQPVWVYSPVRHKTDYRGRRREIYIGPAGQAILSPWLRTSTPADYCFSASASREWYRQQAAIARRTHHSCGNARGRKHDQRPGPGTRQPRPHFDSSSYAHAIRRACLAAGVTHWSPNQLRHTRATLIRQQHGLEAAQVILGHATADVTQIYAERDRELGMRIALQSG